MASKADRRAKGTILIRKEEVVEGEGHGGAWKVAYADFVTAMMAFFLLMWLLNATTEDQRKGLADYFSPNSVLSQHSSGSGQPFGGKTAFSEGALVSDYGAAQVTVGQRPAVDVADPEDSSEVVAQPRPHRDDVKSDAPDQGGKLAAKAPPPPRPSNATEMRAQAEKHEQQLLEQAAQQIREAVRSDPQLAQLARQLLVDLTPDGLRIQLVDAEQDAMFQLGSAIPNDHARLLLQKIAPVLMHMTEDITIAGHTDAAPFAGPGRSNWELSAERANATRRLLVDSGIQDSRIRSVTGNADRQPLLPSEPLAAANRRIAIVVLRSIHASPGAPAPP